MSAIGFDNDLYLELQSKEIIERAKKFDNRLYLEFAKTILQKRWLVKKVWFL